MLWFLSVPAAVALAMHALYGRSGQAPRSIGVAIAIVAAAVMTEASFGAAALTSAFLDRHPIKTADVVLLALRDKKAGPGRYFLGVDTAEGEQYYFYDRRTGDGRVQRAKVYPGEGVSIYEEDRQDAKLVRIGWEFDHPWAALIAFHVTDGKYRYEFHIPAGTMQIAYTMR